MHRKSSPATYKPRSDSTSRQVAYGRRVPRQPGQPLRTMGVLTSYDDARQYAENDPFVRAELVEDWHIREWANIFQ